MNPRVQTPRDPRKRRARSVSTLTLVSLLLTSTASASAQTITVTTVDDRVDFGGARQVPDLPGPDQQVSFREACLAANNTPGPQTIAFNIPKNQWWLYDDRALLRLEDGIFLLSDRETTVDFTTQTAFTGNTNPDGNEVAIYGLEPNAWGVTAILITGEDCTVRGLDRVHQRGYGVQISGNNNRIVGCSISAPLYAGVYVTGGFGGPTPTGNVIGGTSPEDGNSLSGGNAGVRIDGPAGETSVIGNYLTGSFAGIEVRSAARYNLIASDVRIGGPTPEERNIIADAGHYGEEGFPVGTQVSLIEAVRTTVQNNFIGTTADGLASAGQRGPAGIEVQAAIDTIVRDNLISGIAVDGTNHYAGQRFGVGIEITGAATNTLVTGNRIGTDVTGTNAIPNHAGIVVSPFPGSGAPTGTIIGGPGPTEGNIIALNELDGIFVQSPVSGVTISGNSTRTNGGLGIELGAGANNDQAAPVLTAAQAASGHVKVAGTLTSTPSAVFTVEFFAGEQCDPSGFGEGAEFLGSTAVTTDGSGQASLEVTVPLPAGATVITATATADATRSTSEFSACQAIEFGMLRGDLNCDGKLDFGDINPFVLALTDPHGYAAAFPDCDIENGDINADGKVDFGDINPFVSLLTR